MDICEYIPKGHENAVSRQYLRSILNLSDRDIRRAIAESEEPIFWHDGYFRHKNKKDKPYEEVYLKQEQARAKALRKRIRKLKAAVNG